MPQRDSWPTLEVAPSTSPALEFARLVAVHEDGAALVTQSSTPGPAMVAARSLIPLRPQDAGREVVIARVGTAPGTVVVVGLLQDGGPVPRTHVRADGDRIVVTGRRELSLECGKASITLTRAGKVIIRGAYVLSRSSGANRIKGGSVQIN